MPSLQITPGHVRQYVLYRQVLGRSQNEDITAMKKGEKMAKEAVEALSIYEDQGGRLFFTGIVTAEMKKSISYSLKFVLRHDTGNYKLVFPIMFSLKNCTVTCLGDIENAHCECPAGEGPTSSCKHVVASLLVLAQFAATGSLAVLKSCTEQLQTFKRPTKIHQGRPVRAEELGKGVKEDDDPRPDHLRGRASIMDTVYNATVNFASHSGMDIAWRYAFPAANLQEAMVDHHYLEAPFGQY
jgi:hypothetical protein